MRTGRYSLEFTPMGEDVTYTPDLDQELEKRQNILAYCKAVKQSLEALLGRARASAGLSVPPREFEYQENDPDIVLEEEIRSRLAESLAKFDVDAAQADKLRKLLSPDLEDLFPASTALRFGAVSGPSSEVRFYCIDFEGHVRCYGEMLLAINGQPVVPQHAGLDAMASVTVQWQIDMFQPT